MMSYLKRGDDNGETIEVYSGDQAQGDWLCMNHARATWKRAVAALNELSARRQRGSCRA